MPSIPSTGPSTLSSVCTISTATRPCPITMIPTIHEKSTLRPGGRQGAAPSALGVAMADEDGVAAVAEPSAELLDQHDRAVSPPRAPERDGHAAARDAIDEVAERGTELVHGEPTRVDDAIRDLTQRSQLLALTADAVSQAAALGRGMRPPRLAEAPHQHVVARFEVHHLD